VSKGPPIGAKRRSRKPIGAKRRSRKPIGAERRSRKPTLLCISGPNLQLLGFREPEVYGTVTLEQIHQRLATHAQTRGVAVDTRQTNHEGTICDWIAETLDSGTAGIILNPGGYTHTSVAIHDAIKAVHLPCVEVHLSNPDAREEFRRRSVVAPACLGRIAGFGADSYVLALDALVRHMRTT
jgi:3-dehydroquinate dehydratase-2